MGWRSGPVLRYEPSIRSLRSYSVSTQHERGWGRGCRLGRYLERPRKLAGIVLLGLPSPIAAFGVSPSPEREGDGGRFFEAVIPAEAGIHSLCRRDQVATLASMGSRLRGNDSRWRPLRYSRTQVRFEHPVQVHHHELHLGVIHSTLRRSTPGLLGAGVVGEYADELDLAQIVEIQGARVADAAAEYEVELAHALAFLGRGLPPP